LALAGDARLALAELEALAFAGDARLAFAPLARRASKSALLPLTGKPFFRNRSLSSKTVGIYYKRILFAENDNHGTGDFSNGRNGVKGILIGVISGHNESSVFMSVIDVIDCAINDVFNCNMCLVQLNKLILTHTKGVSWVID